MLAVNDPILGRWTYELGSFSSISIRAQGQEVFPGGLDRSSCSTILS